MDFSKIKSLTIPEGNVIKIICDSVVLWSVAGASRIPSEYQEVEWIAAAANVGAYINLGFAYDTAATICLDQWLNGSATTTYPFGAANSTGVLRCMLTSPDGDSAHTSGFYGSNGVNYGSSAVSNNVTNGKNEFVMTVGEGVRTLQNLTTGMTSSGTVSQTAYTMTDNLYLFAQNYKGSPRFGGERKISAFKYYDKNDELICDLVSCYRISDNVIGMYDLVTGAFFTNAGSGTFTKGANVGESIDISEWVHNAIGATFPPSQLPAETAISGSDIDIPSSTANDVYSYIDAIANNYPDYAVKETLGKDASGKYDMVRYMLANRQHYAWQKQDYPKMYAWRHVTEETTEIVPAKANILVGQRYSHSGGKFSAQSGISSVIVPLPEGTTNAVVTLSGMTGSSSYGNCYGGTTNSLFPTNVQSTTPWSDSYKTLTVPNGSLSLDGINYIVFFITSTGASREYDGATITLNGEAIEWEIATTSAITASQEGVRVIAGVEEIIYSISVSPRIDDALYTTPYIGTAKGAVTSVNATNRSRMVGGIEYFRHESEDVEPTVIYTEKDDSRNSGATITQDGATYNRYPLGDLGANQTKLVPIFIYANEHGISPAKISAGTYETKMCALIAARLVRDLCSGVNQASYLYKYIRDYCMLIVIPVANPFGFNLNISGDTPAYAWTADGYYNYNGCNINRNYDTPGWDVMSDSASLKGGYAGSQNETQYIMNTMVESGAVVAMSLHGLSAWEGYCAHQGQQPDGTDYNQTKLTKVVNFLKDNYGYTLRYYDSAPCANMPDVTSKSPSYITQSGAYGGIVEMSPDDVNTSGWKQEMKSNVIENAYAQTLNLMAMWLSDYLEAM